MWFILDVMRKGAHHPRNAWAALLIDVDPDSAKLYAQPVEQRWLDLGQHKTRDDAWDYAEGIITTRH